MISSSGPTAAWSYRQIDAKKVNHVFILGPSHRVYLPGDFDFFDLFKTLIDCALPEVDVYETPLGTLKLDQAIIRTLKVGFPINFSHYDSYIQSSQQFRVMGKDIDEDEHSIEMQLPYLAHVFKDRLDEVTFIPILVGSLDKDALDTYSVILDEYFARDDTIFVISSDFW